MTSVDFYRSESRVKWLISSYLHWSRIVNASRVSLRKLADRNIELPVGTIKGSGTDQTEEELDRQLPRKNTLFKYYEIFSTGYMIYSVFKSVSPLLKVLKEAGHFEHAHCYLAGKSIFEISVGSMFSTSMNIGHLIWRSRLKFYEVRVQSLFMFLYNAPDELPFRPRTQLSESEYHQLVSKRSNAVLVGAMYYPINLGTRSIFRLRANRTTEARDKLVSLMAHCALIMVPALAACVVIVTATYLFTDLIRPSASFNLYYPHCPATTLVEAYTYVFDFFDNFLVFIDSLMAVTVVCPFLYMLTVDLGILWSDIEPKLKALEVSSKYNYLVGGREDHRLRSVNPRLSRTCVLENLLVGNQRQDDDLVHELQTELGDFFKQVRLADEWATAVTSMASIIWMSSFLSIIYGAARSGASGHLAPIVLIEISGCVFVSILFTMLLVLPRRISNSYVRFSSAVAYCRSEMRGKFLIIGEFYQRNRAAYTWFKMIPITSSKLLTFIGWSLTCAVVISSLLR